MERWSREEAERVAQRIEALPADVRQALDDYLDAARAVGDRRDAMVKAARRARIPKGEITHLATWRAAALKITLAWLT
jgi:hypothetical protein